MYLNTSDMTSAQYTASEILEDIQGLVKQIDGLEAKNSEINDGKLVDILTWHSDTMQQSGEWVAEHRELIAPSMRRKIAEATAAFYERVTNVRNRLLVVA